MAISARIFKENGVVAGFVIHRTFDVARARACGDFRNPVDVRRAFSPEGYCVFLGNMARGFSDAEKFRDRAIRRLELQPSFDIRSASNPQSWKQRLVKDDNFREPRHSQINMIETPLHHQKV